MILTSYEGDFAAGWGRKARDLLEQYGGMFGVKVSRRSAATARWDIEGREGGMTTAGVGGPITGKGADLLIIDDPNKNDEEARSASHREKQWDWWQSVAPTRMRPGGLVILIQTRWHRNDLTGRLIREAQFNGQQWKAVKLPALAEPGDPLGRSPGEALWPEMYSLEMLEAKKASRTNYYWRAQYQQDPLAEGGSVIYEMALEIQRTFNPDGFGVERNQFQELLADEMMRLAKERNIWLPVYKMDNTVPKIIRIRRLTSLLSEGMLRFKTNSHGARLLVDQLRDFPRGDKDDGADAAEMAVRLALELLGAARQQERVVGTVFNMLGYRP